MTTATAAGDRAATLESIIAKTKAATMEARGRQGAPGASMH